MSVNSELTSIANKVRALDGTEEKLGLSEMNTKLRKTVSEVSSQSQLIQEIKVALEGKAAGGGIELPKLNNPAEDWDIRWGKQAIDQNGNIIEGYIAEWSPVRSFIDSVDQIQQLSDFPDYFTMLDTTNLNLPIVVDPGVTEVGVMAKKSVFGNATADDVAKGVTFTSENGVQIKGTHECSEGVELPTLTNPGSAEDLVEGMQLINQSGNPVTGTMKSFTGAYAPNATIGFNDYDQEITVALNIDKKYHIDGNTWFGMNPNIFGSATANDVREGVTFTSKSGAKINGAMSKLPGYVGDRTLRHDSLEKEFLIELNNPNKLYLDEYTTLWFNSSNLGNATAADVAAGKTFTSTAGLKVTGTALLPGGGFIYPDGAFTPVTNFTDGKQYALVALIDGNYRYINTTTYNNYTMNATATTIAEDAGNYVIFSSTPVMFTAVASGDGFLLKNGSNYLHGTTSNGTALRVGTTQAVWKVDTSETGGFSSGKYLIKENPNAVWLLNNSSGYNWSIKYETAGSFGYDRNGRDNTYSTGFVSFILFEYVAGEGEISPVVDTSDANVTADKMLTGYSGYANGQKVEGNIQSIVGQTINPSSSETTLHAGYYLAGNVVINPVQTETKSVTENGTYTPSSGKYFSSFTVNVPSGGSGGFQVKTGQTTSRTINTGLSSVDYFVIGKDSVTSTGLINLRYDKTNGTSYIYASAWSTNNYGTKTITTGTTALTVSGGTVTIPSSTATTGGLSSNTTYNWIAVGS